MPEMRMDQAGRVPAVLVLGLILSIGALAWVASPSHRGPAVESRAEKQDAGTSESGAPPSPAIPLSLRDAESVRAGAGETDRAANSPSPGSSSEPGPVLTQCLLETDVNLVRECLRSKLAPRPDSAEIAQVLCSDVQSSDLHLILVSEALSRIAAAEALDWIDDLQRGCRRYQESGLLQACLLARKEQEPAWFAEFRATLTPERLIEEQADEAGIQIAALFAGEGDREVREWIQAGARGEWGGTVKQIDRAIGVSIALQTPGEEWLSNLHSILRSATVPAGGAIGSTFVHALLDPRAWPNSSSSPALDTLVTVLYDPRFQDSAAATICLSFPPQPPAGCDPQLWEVVRARAMEIANQIGLSIPGQPR